MSAPAKEEHAVKMLTPWETKLRMLEDWLDNLEIADDCQQTIMQIVGEDHSTEFLRNFSQEAKQMMTAALRHATEEGAEFQFGEQLEEDGNIPAGELADTNLSEGEVEQQLSDETVELESALEWQLSATRGDENSMGDQVDLPIAKKEVLQRRLPKRQPLEQLDRVIEEIRRLMLKSATEVVSKEKLSRRKPARAVGKQQQQQSNGAGGKI
jgi:hypothetical protein